MRITPNRVCLPPTRSFVMSCIFCGLCVQVLQKYGEAGGVARFPLAMMRRRWQKGMELIHANKSVVSWDADKRPFQVTSALSREVLPIVSDVIWQHLIDVLVDAGRRRGTTGTGRITKAMMLAAREVLPFNVKNRGSTQLEIENYRKNFPDETGWLSTNLQLHPDEKYAEKKKKDTE